MPVDHQSHPLSLLGKNRPTQVVNLGRPMPVAPPCMEQPRRPILTISSPERDNDAGSSKKMKNTHEELCSFLKNCSLCKKKIDSKKNVYMYGYLGAFCSPGCRADKIALDGFDKKVTKETKNVRGGNVWSSKGHHTQDRPTAAAAARFK